MIRAATDFVAPLLEFDGAEREDTEILLVGEFLQAKEHLRLRRILFASSVSATVASSQTPWMGQASTSRKLRCSMMKRYRSGNCRPSSREFKVLSGLRRSSRW